MAERHRALIDDLERELFPFQESEEEQESFTPEGRRRVDDWIHKLLLQFANREALEAELDKFDRHFPEY
jgi:hypothetical protein